jgi:hypothetical protein
MTRAKKSHRIALLCVLLALAFVTIGSGTCVIVEEGPPGAFDGPGHDDQETNRSCLFGHAWIIARIGHRAIERAFVPETS